MLELTDQNFNEIIQKDEEPILVDFWSPHCLPCHILSPILEKIANDYHDKIVVAKVNLDEAPIIAQKYGIDQVPTVVLFRKGQAVGGFIGARPEPIIRQFLDKMLEEAKEENKKIADLIRESEEYAAKNNFKLNPNQEVVEKIIKGLLTNEKKYGARYCPCRRVTGNLDKDKKIICPCQFMSKEIEEQGHCLCRLFVKQGGLPPHLIQR